MKINGFSSPGSNGQNSAQAIPIEQRIEKLEEEKRKIEKDLAKRSTNPDPKAAIGDNNANSAVNQKILKQLESQINTLKNRLDSVNQNSASNESDNVSKKISTQYDSQHIDVFV